MESVVSAPIVKAEKAKRKAPESAVNALKYINEKATELIKAEPSLKRKEAVKKASEMYRKERDAKKALATNVM